MLSPTVSQRPTYQRREPLDSDPQSALAGAHLSHGFDYGLSVRETCVRLGGISRTTLYRRIDEFKARGLEEMPTDMRRRIFSARSVERVVAGSHAPTMRRRKVGV
jgi:hypothetical protein